MIDQLIEDLKRDEGFKSKPYYDSEGWLTLGYGFLIDPKRSTSIPKQVADYWLEYAINARFAALLDEIPWIVDQPEGVQRALGNIAYQLGIKGLLGFKRMLKALEAGDRETAAVEALDSRYAKQTPARARRIAALIRGHE